MSQDFKTWLTRVMTKIIDRLGPDVSEVEYELTEPIDSNRFMSAVLHVNVKFHDDAHGRREKLALILKRPTHVEAARKISCSDFQFCNETLFYRAYAQPNDNFPRCLYYELRPPVDSVIALTDVTASGYGVCPYTYDVPLDYTLAATREIARFHGKGYAMKELRNERFLDIVARIRETRYHETDGCDNSLKRIINVTSTRAVEYLRGRGHDAAFCDKAEALLSNAYREVMLKSTRKPDPRLSTLCHGDFTASNVLFKTDDDGQHRAMLIDFAIMRHATPVVDLSTYLSLCCANEVRREKFAEILRTYHDALNKYLLEAGVKDMEKYSYDALLDDYRRGGLFGFVIASFFLPILRGKLQYDAEALADIEAHAELMKRSGGDEISEILAEMLLHLKDLGCPDL